MDILIGCDPELFVRNKTTGLSVSAFGLIPGTKKDPYIVGNGAVQVDGMALEFNTNPAATFNEFDANIVSVMKDMKAMISDDLLFDIIPSVVFDDETLAAMPDVAKELGCDPDYNAYTMEANPRPVPPVPGLRTASGHVHIGLGEFKNWRGPDHFSEMSRLVRGLDRFVGLTSVLMDPDPTRRVLYGAAGAMRVKPYGVEYRVPSNAWIKTKVRRKVMYDAVQSTINWLVEDKCNHDVMDKDVQNAINSSDVAECTAMLTFMKKGI